jgi:WD40 repeat protein
MSDRRCPECQAPLESGALDGICPRCLAGLLFDPGPIPEATLVTEENRATTPPMTTRSVLLELPGYEVTRELARGGMGIVYQATQLEPRREVALKMLLPHQLEAEAFQERFLLEARAIARLEHPHILPVYQVGEHDGVPFFTMKLAAGGSLAERRTRYRRSWREIAELVATLADAVQYAHERGVLHRDLKPGNVLFDDTGRPYVSDFGLAKLADDTMPEEEPGQVIGTPRYVAPEVAGQGSQLATVASDIYGLGIILYEMLAQKSPFAALSQQALLRMVADAPPPPPSVELRGVPHELDIICMRCLEKDPHRRFQTAGALTQELKRWLVGEPIESLPATRQEQFWRWLRQQQAIVGLTAAIAVLGLVLVVGSVWVAFSLMASRRAVVSERDRARGDLVKARLGEARGLRLSGHIQNRARALELLSGAAQAEDRVELRNEAAAMLGRWDVGPEEDRHRHAGAGLPVSLSASLDLVADGRADGEVRVWKRATGSPLWKLPAAGAIAPTRLEFSPGTRWVAAVSEDQFRLVEVSTGTVVVHQTGRWLGFSADGQVAVFRTPDRHVEYRDIATRKVRHRLPLPSDALDAIAVSDATQSPDVLVQWRDHLEVLSPETGNSLQWLPFHRGEVRAVTWKDGYILVGDNTGGLRLWNMRSGRLRDLAGHRGPVRRLVVSPDGSLAWSVSDDGQTRLWHVRTGQLLGTAELWEPLQFSQDGTRLVYVDGPSFGIAPMMAPVAVQMVPLRFGGSVRHLEFSPDGRWLVGVGQRGIAVLDPFAGHVVCSVETPGAVSAHFEPEGRRLAVIHRNGVRWFEFREESRRVTLVPETETRPPEPQWMGRALGDGDGRTLLIPTARGSLLGFDLVDGRWIPVPREVGPAGDAMIDPNGQWIAVKAGGTQMSVFPSKGGHVLRLLEPGYGSPFFSPDGRHLLVAGGEMHQVYTTEDWRVTTIEPTGGGSTTPGMGRWSKYGRAFAVAGPRSGVSIVSTETWKPVVRLEAPLPVSCLAMDPHGRRVAAGTDDDHVAIWGLPELRTAMNPLGLDWTERIFPDGVTPVSSGAGFAGESWPVVATEVRVLRPAAGAGKGGIDLGNALNEPLDSAEGVFTSPRDRPFGLVSGLTRIGGEEFDIRGFVRVSDTPAAEKNGGVPRQSAPVAIGRPVVGISTLLSALPPRASVRGLECARMRVRWVDGQEAEVPLRLGMEVGGWHGAIGDAPLENAVVAWEGLSEVSEASQCLIRLYRHSWVNPKPTVAVDRIWWLASKGGGSLRVLGVSARD